VELPEPPEGARPFYDLVASIAAEEFGHVELVAATISTMLTDAADAPAARGRRKADDGPGTPLAGLKGVGNPHHWIAGGLGALPQNSQGRPWNGDYVFSSGDLIEDLTHNFFLETGARNNKLKVYEAVDHPAARALTGYLLVRGGVHQVAYARAVERLTGSDLMKMFPSPRIPTDKIPECRPHLERGEHTRLYRFSPGDFQELAAVFTGPHPETGEPLGIAEDIHPAGAPAHDLPPEPGVFAPDVAPEEIAEIAARLREQAGLPREPTGEVASTAAPKPRARASRTAAKAPAAGAAKRTTKKA
jgi:Mn-containing catalase